VERLTERPGGTRREEIDADLSEAMGCGFHHLHLTLRLYERLLETLPADESQMPEAQKERP
jgi:hypothetical protein